MNNFADIKTGSQRNEPFQYSFLLSALLNPLSLKEDSKARFYGMYYVNYIFE